MFFGLRYVVALNAVQCVDLGIFLNLAPFENIFKIQISHERNVKSITNHISECSFLFVERSDTKYSFLTKVDLDMFLH